MIDKTEGKHLQAMWGQERLFHVKYPPLTGFLPCTVSVGVSGGGQLARMI